MDDRSIWDFERQLWLGGGDVYRNHVAPDCIMALPADPFLYDGKAATVAVEKTPRWDSVDFTETRVTRVDEGLIVVGYRAKAKRGDASYRALCTTTLRRLDHDEWVVVQHQQTPFGVEVHDPDA